MSTYKITFYFGLKSTSFGNAYINYNTDSGTVNVYFDKNYKKIRGDATLINDIKLAAKHEAIHLLLSKVSAYACWRWTTRDQYTFAEEEVTRKLERFINV